jgi:transglutaminase-like putative cysteine protease
VTVSTATATAYGRLVFDVSEPTWLAVQVAVARRKGLDISDRFEALNNGVPLTTQELTGPHQGRQHLLHADPGPLLVTYETAVSRNAPATAEPVTPEQRIAALRPSRYCPADRMAGFARSHFGRLPNELERVRAICTYAWEHLRYQADTSGPATDAIDTLLVGHGVCRDFAHLVAALCRAVDVPTRIAAVYAPGLSPMDFHVIAETAINGNWYVWDATRSAPRTSMIRIATGRDAADVAFISLLGGQAEMTGMQITVASPDDLPLDAHEELVVLG